MARIHLLSDPPSDYGTFSGGAWVTPNLPLTNLITQQPKQVARSQNTLEASTRFVCDLGAATPVESFALVGGNLTAASTIRIRVSNNSDGSSPLLNVVVPGFPPNLAFGSLPWGQFPWNGYRNDPLPAGQIVFYQAAMSVTGRYVLIDISDTANPAGYVQIGRFMAGIAFVPKHNFIYGASFKWNDPTRVSTSVGGQKYFDKRPNFRSFSCSFDAASESEAYGAVYDMQRRIGISGNLLMVYDPEDRVDVLTRRTIYGSMPDLTDIVTANADALYPYAWNFKIEELI